MRSCPIAHFGCPLFISWLKAWLCFSGGYIWILTPEEGVIGAVSLYGDKEPGDELVVKSLRASPSHSYLSSNKSLPADDKSPIYLNWTGEIST